MAKKSERFVSLGRKWVRSVARAATDRFADRNRKVTGLSPFTRIFTSRRVSRVSAVDARRRAFLKYAMFGGAVFLSGKYIGPIMNMLRGDTVLSEKTFQNFKITETGRQLKVSDNDGEDLLIIDKEEF